ncbi:MAG: class I SAM-dependent methyltransferase [Bacteroidales bacterium]|jgi:SAM-dependent methyltransferase|nr:class I SAM-dependent methyltransferase [Bacteroidales bacterium]
MKKMKQAQNYALDDPQRTLIHKEIILEKSFLKKLYAEWYHCFMEKSQTIEGDYLEIGSGGGFLKEVFPNVITSDVLDLDTVDMTCNAQQLPFNNESLAAIMMLNVFHHIPKPHQFLEEAQRTLVPNGKIIMIEPANTPFAKFVYTHFHHEDFDPNGEMEIAEGKPLSCSNQALPYIYFKREKEAFVHNFPLLEIVHLDCHTPFAYLLSGGLSKPSMLPGFLYGFTRNVEKLFSPLNELLGLFYMIEIEKKSEQDIN